MKSYTVTRVIKGGSKHQEWIGECTSDGGRLILRVSDCLAVSSGDQIYCDIQSYEERNGLAVGVAAKLSNAEKSALQSQILSKQMSSAVSKYRGLDRLSQALFAGDLRLKVEGGLIAARYPRVKMGSVRELAFRHKGTLAALKSPSKLSLHYTAHINDTRVSDASPSGWKELRSKYLGPLLLRMERNKQRDQDIYAIQFSEGNFTPFAISAAISGPGVYSSAVPKNVNVCQYLFDAHEYGHSLDPRIRTIGAHSPDFSWRRAEAFADVFAIIETLNAFGGSAHRDIDAIVRGRETALIGSLIKSDGTLALDERSRYLTGMAGRAALQMYEDWKKDKTNPWPKDPEDVYAAARKISDSNTLTDAGLEYLKQALADETTKKRRIRNSFVDFGSKGRSALSIKSGKEFLKDLMSALQPHVFTNKSVERVLERVGKKNNLLGRYASRCLKIRSQNGFVMTTGFTLKQSKHFCDLYNKDISRLENAVAEGKLSRETYANMLEAGRDYLGSQPFGALYERLGNDLEDRYKKVSVYQLMADGVIQNVKDDPTMSPMWGMSADTKLRKISSHLEAMYEISASERKNPETGFANFSEFRRNVREVLRNIEPILLDSTNTIHDLDLSVKEKKKLTKQLISLSRLNPEKMTFPMSWKQMVSVRSLANSCGSSHAFGSNPIPNPIPNPVKYILRDKTSSESMPVKMF